MSEGMGRTGKGLIIFRLGLRAFIAGMDMKANCVARFPDKSVHDFEDMDWREWIALSELNDSDVDEVHYRRLKMMFGRLPEKLKWSWLKPEWSASHGWYCVPRIKLTDVIDVNTGDIIQELDNTCFIGHEFNTWTDSRIGVADAVTIGTANFIQQGGKRGNMFAVDCHDFDSLDKRMRLDTSVRIWAIGGKEKLTYGWYDRTIMQMSVVRVRRRYLIDAVGRFYDTDEKAVYEKLLAIHERKQNAKRN